MWATIDRRTFLVGTSAALLAQAGLTDTSASAGVPTPGSTFDPYGFASFVSGRWPEVRMARADPSDGVDYTARLPVNDAVEGVDMACAYVSRVGEDGA